MNEWQKHIEARRAGAHPGLKMVALRPCDDMKDKAQAEATALMAANPNLKLIMNICSPAVPGAAEAVKQAGKTGKVKVEAGTKITARQAKKLEEEGLKEQLVTGEQLAGSYTAHPITDAQRRDCPLRSRGQCRGIPRDRGSIVGYHNSGSSCVIGLQ